MRGPKPPPGYYLARHAEYMAASKQQAQEIADNLTPAEIDGVLQGLAAEPVDGPLEPQAGQGPVQEPECDEQVNLEHYLDDILECRLDMEEKQSLSAIRT